jgi:hypothetical protein
MTDRGKIIILIVSFFVGIAAGWGYFQSVRPTADQLLLMRIDDAIRENLCVRIQNDLKRFDESPQTFRRSSLEVLIKESSAVASTIFQDIGDDLSVKYRGIESKSIASMCEKDAKRWLKISSHFPELYEDEVGRVLGVGSVTIISNSSEMPLAATKSQTKRLALVVGNSRYESRPLKNPANDARDMASSLRELGFEVIERYDANLSDMREAVEIFEDQLQRNDVGLVYYSGHGIEFSGRNYFIPIDADIKSEEEIPRQGFDVTQIVEKMGRSNVKTAIFIIDACRNAPVFSSFKSAKPGLAMMQSSRGSIVAFSAAPGQVALDGNGRNSPYTTALLKQITIPNKRIEDVMKDTAHLVSDGTNGRQLPWYNSSLVGDFYFLKQDQGELQR